MIIVMRILLMLHDDDNNRNNSNSIVIIVFVAIIMTPFEASRVAGELPEGERTYHIFYLLQAARVVLCLCIVYCSG